MGIFSISSAPYTNLAGYWEDSRRADLHRNHDSLLGTGTAREKLGGISYLSFLSHK